MKFRPWIIVIYDLINMCVIFVFFFAFVLFFHFVVFFEMCILCVFFLLFVLVFVFVGFLFWMFFWLVSFIVCSMFEISQIVGNILIVEFLIVLELQIQAKFPTQMLSTKKIQANEKRMMQDNCQLMLLIWFQI